MYVYTCTYIGMYLYIDIRNYVALPAQTLLLLPIFGLVLQLLRICHKCLTYCLSLYMFFLGSFINCSLVYIDLTLFSLTQYSSLIFFSIALACFVLRFTCGHLTVIDNVTTSTHTYKNYICSQVHTYSYVHTCNLISISCSTSVP